MYGIGIGEKVLCDELLIFGALRTSAVHNSEAAHSHDTPPRQETPPKEANTTEFNASFIQLEKNAEARVKHIHIR